MERASSVDGWEEFDRGRAIAHNRQEWRELHLWMGRKSLIEEEPLHIITLKNRGQYFRSTKFGESFTFCGWVVRKSLIEEEKFHSAHNRPPGISRFDIWESPASNLIL